MLLMGVICCRTWRGQVHQKVLVGAWFGKNPKAKCRTQFNDCPWEAKSCKSPWTSRRFNPSLPPENGAANGIRTRDPKIHNLMCMLLMNYLQILQN